MLILQCLGNTFQTSSVSLYKLPKQCFGKALARFTKELSLRYLKSFFLYCLRSILETLPRCLSDVFTSCLNNGFVRNCLYLQRVVFQTSWKHLDKMSRCLGKTIVRYFANVFWPNGSCNCKATIDRSSRELCFKLFFVKFTRNTCSFCLIFRCRCVDLG